MSGPFIPHPNAEHPLAALVNSATKRATYDTATKCQALIDRMETDIPHDQLSPAYDWLVDQRDTLRRTGHI